LTETLWEDIVQRYPAQKPVCFNYIRAREDIYRLCEIIQEQQRQIDELQNQEKGWYT